VGDYPHRWFLGFRDIARSTDERTAIFSLVPWSGVGHTMPLVLPKESTPVVACLLANLDALPFDCPVRQKVGGTHLSYTFLRQFPVLPPRTYESDDLSFIAPRVLELVYTAWDMAPFAANLWSEADDALQEKLQAQKDSWYAEGRGHEWDPPDWAGGDDCPAPFTPAKWDEGRRAILRAELDAYFARLYGLTRDELRYILDPEDVYGPEFPGETFRGLKEKEKRQYGEYRTRRLVLEAWDWLEAELGPVVVRRWRGEVGSGR
jgi:hypothetical protein